MRHNHKHWPLELFPSLSFVILHSPFFIIFNLHTHTQYTRTHAHSIYYPRHFRCVWNSKTKCNGVAVCDIHKYINSSFASQAQIVDATMPRPTKKCSAFGEELQFVLFIVDPLSIYSIQASVLRVVLENNACVVCVYWLEFSYFFSSLFSYFGRVMLKVLNDYLREFSCRIFWTKKMNSNAIHVYFIGFVASEQANNRQQQIVCSSRWLNYNNNHGHSHSTTKTHWKV